MRPGSRPRLNSLATAAFTGAALTAAGVAVAGCSDLVRASRLQPAGVNVESPAAGVVLAAEARRTPFPTFRDVPPKVADLRPNRDYAGAVAGLNGERSALHEWEAQNPPMLSDTQGFAGTTRGAMTVEAAGETPPADQSLRSAAWAAKARDAAKVPAKAGTPPGSGSQP